MRHPSLLKQQAAAQRKVRERPRKSPSPVKPNVQPANPDLPNDHSYWVLNRLLVKSIVSIVIVALTLWVRDHPLSVPNEIKDPIAELAVSSFSFASMQEKWGHYIGYGETSSRPAVYTSDLLYAAPVLSMGDSTMEKQGDQLLITAVKGENVYATEAGIVLFVGDQVGEQMLVLQHADKRQTIYKSIVPTALRPFDHVDRGEPIGQVLGDSGFSLSIRDDQGYLDPSTLFMDNEE